MYQVLQALDLSVNLYLSGGEELEKIHHELVPNAQPSGEVYTRFYYYCLEQTQFISEN